MRWPSGREERSGSPSRILATTLILGALVGIVVVGIAGAQGAVIPATGTADTGTQGTSTPDSATNTTDTDGDGLSDSRERELGTDPATADTDGDGLSDYRETLLTTAPTDSDTDGDGLSDGEEIRLHTDPLDSDTDGDGISDAAEQSGPTDPRYEDTDDDGLSDGTEQEGATDPTGPDTDNDGLPDGAERHSDQLSGADSLRHDVFVEIDYTWSERLSPNQRQALVELFETAPTENPDGSTGISLHLTMSNQVPSREEFNELDLTEYHRRYMNNTCGGYVYAVLTPDPAAVGKDVGGFAVDQSLVSLGDTSVFLHELGHVKGLGPGIEGVDSRSVPMRTYPSVMNYNAPGGFLNYSTGMNGARDHDDWSKIANTGVSGYGNDLFPYTDNCARAGD